jgi:hypothetical protein
MIETEDASRKKKKAFGTDAPKAWLGEECRPS